MPAHSSHILQPLDVSCFSVLKRAYGDLVKAKMLVGVNHIDKPLFLELYYEAHKKTFTPSNIQSGFRATGLVPFNPDHVLSKLKVQVRTPSPLPTPEVAETVTSASVIPLKTPSNILELERLQKQGQLRTSPTDRALQKIAKGCHMAMHNAVLLSKENSQLRAENQRQKRKRAQRRAFIQTGGTMTIGEGISRTEAHLEGQAQQEVRQEAEEGVASPAETAPKTRKRAQPKCSSCGSIEHNARTCPDK
jgi:hypothetical protein